jgi:hypothetical protein
MENEIREGALIEMANWVDWENDDQCRMTKMASELLALRADAETSQNHNAAVIDPLITQLRDAGYEGTLTEMVGQACVLLRAWNADVKGE